MLFFCCCCFFYFVSNWSEPSILQRYLSCPPPPHFLALVRCKETTPTPWGLGLFEVQTWKLCGMLTLKTFWLRPRLHKCTVCQFWLSQTVLFKVQSAGLFAKMMASAIWNCTLKGCTMHTWSGGSGSPVSVLDNTSQSAPKSHWTLNNNVFRAGATPYIDIMYKGIPANLLPILNRTMNNNVTDLGGRVQKWDFRCT